MYLQNPLGHLLLSFHWSRFPPSQHSPLIASILETFSTEALYSRAVSPNQDKRKLVRSGSRAKWHNITRQPPSNCATKRSNVCLLVSCVDFILKGGDPCSRDSILWHHLFFRNFCWGKKTMSKQNAKTLELENNSNEAESLSTLSTDILSIKYRHWKVLLFPRWKCIFIANGHGITGRYYFI